MKKIYLLSIALFLVCAANAQTEFTVPTLTLQQRCDGNRDMVYNYIISSINLAKSDGMTVEEFAKKSGEVFIPVWDKDTGFDGFVNYMLGYWAKLSDSVQIIEQSNEKVVFVVPHIYPWFENQGVFVGVSLEELTTFVNEVHKVIANHFDLGFEMTWGEEGLKTAITQE